MTSIKTNFRIFKLDDNSGPTSNGNIQNIYEKETVGEITYLHLRKYFFTWVGRPEKGEWMFTGDRASR